MTLISEKKLTKARIHDSVSLDDFDEYYGTQGFGYPDCHYTILPEVSLEFCTISTTEGYNIPKKSFNIRTEVSITISRGQRLSII